MAFSWKAFLTDVLEMAPLAVSGVEAIIPGASTETKSALATQSLTLATGLSKIALSNNPEDQALANAASSVAQAVINEASVAPNATTAVLNTLPIAAQVTSAITGASPGK